jgi:hypothetical protein
MTFDEMLGKVLELFPEALFHDEENGEVIISTGFRLVNDELIPMEEI